MGFNSVHLLPVTTLDTSESPYAANNLFDIDPSYLPGGSPQDGWAQLDEYVGVDKALAICMCFDLVLNNMGGTSMRARRVPDWGGNVRHAHHGNHAR